MGGGESPHVWVSAVQGGGEEKQGKLELLLAAHSAQSPFSNPSMLAGRTVGRDTAGAQQTQTQPGSLKPWQRLHNLLLMVITITGLDRRPSEMYWMCSNRNATSVSSWINTCLVFLLHPVDINTSCSLNSHNVPHYYFLFIQGIRPDHRHVCTVLSPSKWLMPKGGGRMWDNHSMLLGVRDHIPTEPGRITISRLWFFLADSFLDQ